MSSDPTFRISPFAPANETLAMVKQERMDINGYILGAVGYGVHVTLFFMCLSLLRKRLRKDPISTKLFLCYITFNFILGSIGNGINCFDNQAQFVDNRDFPGGPEGYVGFVSTGFLNVFGAAIYIINTWSQDGLLLYRFCVIFDYNYWIISFPILAYVASILMSCLYLATITHSTTPFGANITNFGLAYWSLSIGTTIILTFSIVGHLLIMRHRIQAACGTKQVQGSPYLSISAMFIESAFLYSVVGLITLVCFGKNFPAVTLVLPLLGQVQSIAPLMIILRVAHGQALQRDTFKNTRSDTLSPSLNFQGSKTAGDSYHLSDLSSSTTKNQSREVLVEEKGQAVKASTGVYAGRAV